MGSRRRMFGWMYRLGLVPWDGHALAHSLCELVEGDGGLPAGNALDLGCGTGDNSIYLAQHGWDVTGVDFVAKPLDKARAKAAAAGVAVTFRQADVTRLTSGSSSVPLGTGFDLIVDSGCLHGMSPDDRDAYVREVTAVASPGGRLHIVAFLPGASWGVPGIAEDEIRARFAADWSLVSSGSEAAMDHNGKDPARYYLFQRCS